MPGARPAWPRSMRSSAAPISACAASPSSTRPSGRSGRTASRRSAPATAPASPPRPGSRGNSPGSFILPRLKLPGEFPREPGRGGEAGAVAGADLLDAVRPERPDGLVELGLAAQAEMGAADDRMDLGHAGLAPGMLDGVDQPGMAAAEDQDEPLPSPDHQRLVVRQGVGRAAAVITAEV